MFICSKCGICCRNIDKIPQLSKYHNGDGVCIYLTDDNLCSIYDRRPDICNVNRMYEKEYKMIMTREEFDKLNMQGCKLLKQKQLNYNKNN